MKRCAPTPGNSPALLALLGLGLAAWLPAAAAGQALTFQLDPRQTRVEFTLGATMHEVTGSLRLVEGSIHFAAAGGTASGRLVVDATSAATGNSSRDSKMHDKVLESARFPRIVYTVERVDGSLQRTGSSDLRLHGTLEMHGTSRPLVIAVVATTAGDTVNATGSMTVPYVDWGLQDPSVFVLRVDKEVRITIHASGKLTG